MQKVNKICTTLLTMLLLIFFISCQTNKVQEKEHTTNPVYVTNSKKVYLLNPSEMDGFEDSYQLLNGQFGDTKFSLLCYFYCDQNGIEISLLNDFGTDMGSLSYDGVSVNFASEVFPKNLKAEYILLDIQNAYYKAESLKATYAAAGIQFEEENSDNVSRRIIKSGNKIIEMITKNGNFIKIQNYVRGYEYNLTVGEE